MEKVKVRSPRVGLGLCFRYHRYHGDRCGVTAALAATAALANPRGAINGALNAINAKPVRENSGNRLLLAFERTRFRVFSSSAFSLPLSPRSIYNVDLQFARPLTNAAPSCPLRYARAFKVTAPAINRRRAARSRRKLAAQLRKQVSRPRHDVL